MFAAFTAVRVYAVWLSVKSTLPMRQIYFVYDRKKEAPNSVERFIPGSSGRLGKRSRAKGERKKTPITWRGGTCMVTTSRSTFAVTCSNILTKHHVQTQMCRSTRRSKIWPVTRIVAPSTRDNFEIVAIDVHLEDGIVTTFVLSTTTTKGSSNGNLVRIISVLRSIERPWYNI